MFQILCLDEDVAGLDRMEEMLRDLGHNPVAACSVGQGLAALEQEVFDLVVARSGRFDAAAPIFVERLRAAGCDVPVLFVARNSDDAPDLPPGQTGIDVLPGPLELARLREAVDRALAAGGLERVIQERTAECDEPPIIGEAACIRRVLDVAASVAASAATILIQGESGTGKELLVRSIHCQSPRSRRPLVAVNCAALPEGLIESTLFGHERGAFTGATGRHPGAFERAHGGTLLLDEISELRLDLQAKLLRALQERQVERVGGTRPIAVDVRVIATSNRNLAAEVRAGRFRSDLYYRLNVVNLSIPPLRRRREDIRPLVNHFVERASRELNIEPPPIGESTLKALEAECWPGNIRELQHASQRAVLLNRSGPLTPADFLSVDEEGRREQAHNEMDGATFLDETPDARDRHDEGPEVNFSGVLNLRKLEQHAIMKALKITGGHRTRAAGLLGISDRTLRNKLKTSGRSVASVWRQFQQKPADSAGSDDRSGETGRPATGNRRASAVLVPSNPLPGNALG